MALDKEEMNRRRQEREAQKKELMDQQRKLRKKLIIVAAVLLICSIAIYILSGGTAPEDSNDQVKHPAYEQTEATEESRSRFETLKVIKIRAAGDLNVTDSVILAGAGSDGYNFNKCFLDIAPTLSDADLTLLNFEGNLCGEPYGTKSTSAPVQLAQALRAAGVDIVQMANSCSVNNGLIGLSSTLAAFRNAGIEPVGAYSSPQEFKQTKGYTICDIQGIRVAVVAFTKGVGSMGLPAGNEDCVNLLYTDYMTTYQNIDKDGIRSILKDVASEKPDIVIAMLHWGSELNDTISESQENIVKLMQSNGVDVILGTHSHRVQPIVFDEAKGTLVAYSLGDFFGDATSAGSNYSIILDIEITRDTENDTVAVTGYSYTPIYTLTESETCDNQRRVVVIEDTMRVYDDNFVDRVTKAAYDSMKNALERIDARVVKKEEKK